MASPWFTIGHLASLNGGFCTVIPWNKGTKENKGGNKGVRSLLGVALIVLSFRGRYEGGAATASAAGDRK